MSHGRFVQKWPRELLRSAPQGLIMTVSSVNDRFFSPKDNFKRRQRSTLLLQLRYRRKEPRSSIHDTLKDDWLLEHPNLHPYQAHNPL